MVGLGIALVVTVIAAGLLLWIIGEARGIANEATRALAAAALIDERTAALDGIPTVNGMLKDTIGTVLSIHAKASGLADALGAPPAPAAPAARLVKS